MLAARPIASRRRLAGVTMLEVLVTLVILAFGLLGLAGLQTKIQMLDMEAYQRAQAILLLRDMVERIKSNSANAASYAGASVYGTDYSLPSDCALTLAGSDLCQWSEALTGAAESSSGTRVGAMIGARGCIKEITTANATDGVCLPGVYRVTVAWQGLYSTSAPSLTCGATKYGSDEGMRRAISSDIVIGLPTCI